MVEWAISYEAVTAVRAEPRAAANASSASWSPRFIVQPVGFVRRVHEDRTLEPTKGGGWVLDLERLMAACDARTQITVTSYRAAR